MEEREFFEVATDILKKHIESGSVEYFINDISDLIDEWEENDG